MGLSAGLLVVGDWFVGRVVGVCVCVCVCVSAEDNYSAGMSLTQTKNNDLQNKLNEWSDMLAVIDNQTAGLISCRCVHMFCISDVITICLDLEDRMNKILLFTRSFVPVDVSEDDIQYFASNLMNDNVSQICPIQKLRLNCFFQEYFLSIKRDIMQCATGQNVESIKGNQRKKALFTIKPLDGLRKH